MEYTTSVAFSYSESGDITAGILYLTFFVVGLMGNSLVMLYYRRRKKDLATWLYLLTAINDIIIVTMGTVVAACFLNVRLPTLFLKSESLICYIWAFVYHNVQKLSVFLIATLSISRTFTLLFPLKHVNKRFVLLTVAIYLVIIMTYETILTAMRFQKAVYLFEDVYCYMEISEDSTAYTHINRLDNAQYIILLALPLIAVCFSCTISSYRILKSSVISNATSSTTISLRRRASITIIILTVIYITFNLPLLINYILWNITTEYYGYPGPIYGSHAIMYYYSWNFTDVFCMCANSSTNPIVLLNRVRSYRQWVSRSISQIRSRKKVGIASFSSHHSSFPHNYTVRNDMNWSIPLKISRIGGLKTTEPWLNDFNYVCVVYVFKQWNIESISNDNDVLCSEIFYL